MTDQTTQSGGASETFLVQCTSCHAKLRIPMKYMNQKVKCSKCSSTFVAASATEPQAPPAPPKPSKPKRSGRRSSGASASTGNSNVRPDSLLGDFKGRKLIGVIVLAIILHAILIGGTSYTYLIEEFTGKDTSEMSKDDKVKVALDEARSALGKIAERHNLTLDDLTDRMGSGGSRGDKLLEATDKSDKSGSDKAGSDKAGSGDTKTAPESDPDDGKSTFEKDLIKPVKGPDEGDEPIDDNLGM